MYQWLYFPFFLIARLSAICLVFCTLTLRTSTAISVLPEEGLSLVYDQAEDLGELWTRTKEILPYKEVSDEWLKEKFGIEIVGNKIPTTPQKLTLDFFD